MSVLNKLIKLPVFLKFIFMGVVFLFAFGCAMRVYEPGGAAEAAETYGWFVGYEVNQEVIRASDAAPVFGLVGTYTTFLLKDVKATITAVPNSNDYRATSSSEEGSSTIYFRAIPLRRNIYIFQTRGDDMSSYSLIIVKIASKKVLPMEIKSQNQVYSLARQYGVTLTYWDDWDDLDLGMFGYKLSGYRNNILAFLRAHKSLAIF